MHGLMHHFPTLDDSSPPAPPRCCIFRGRESSLTGLRVCTESILEESFVYWLDGSLGGDNAVLISRSIINLGEGSVD